MRGRKLSGWLPLMVSALSMAITGLSGCGGGGGQASAFNATTALLDTGRLQSCGVAPYVPNFASESDPATGRANALYHWNEMPVTIYFDTTNDYTPERRQAVLAGFDWWVKASHGLISYQVTTDRSLAQIVVAFAKEGYTEYGALTTVQFDSSRILTSAHISFNVTYLTLNELYPPAAAHEFGHALGIGGHSNNDGDIMASSPKVYSDTGISDRDLNTIKSVYCPGGRVAESGNSTGSRTLIIH